MTGEGSAPANRKAAQDVFRLATELLGELYASRGTAEAQSSLVRCALFGVGCDTVIIAEAAGGVLVVRETTDAGLREKRYAIPYDWDAVFEQGNSIPRARQLPVRGGLGVSTFPEMPCASALAVPIFSGTSQKLALVCLSSVDASFTAEDAHSLSSLAAIARMAFKDSGAESESVLEAHHQQAVSKVTPGVKHDFNNLVSVICGSAQLIEESVGETSMTHLHAERIRKAGTEAAQLVFRLLEMIVPDQERETIDIRGPITHALGLAGSALGPNVTLKSDLPEQPIYAEAKLADLMHVVVNLIIAARDALIDEIGEILVRLDAVTASEVRVKPRRISAGAIVPGIDYARLRVTINEFASADGETPSPFDHALTSSEPNSSVIGLAVAAEIVAQAGGAFRVSDSPPTGAASELLWPLSDELSPDTIDPVAPACEGLRNATILVVDDVSDVSEVLSAMLEDAGASVATCSDPADAIEALTEDPDAWTLLVTDLDMPGMDGLELTRKCRSVCPDLAVLLCTALSHRVRQAANEALFEGIVVKPFSRDELITAAARAVARREGEEHRKR